MSDVSSSNPIVNVSKLYRTSDLYFGAFLASLDFPLKTTEQSSTTDGGRKIVFVFSIPEADLSKIKAMYFGGSGTVKARVFVDHLRSLKSMCYTVLVISLIPYCYINILM
jgi:hypothetical protein